MRLSTAQLIAIAYYMLSIGATVPQVDGQGETEEALIQKRSYDYYQEPCDDYPQQQQQQEPCDYPQQQQQEEP